MTGIVPGLLGDKGQVVRLTSFSFKPNETLVSLMTAGLANNLKSVPNVSPRAALWRFPLAGVRASEEENR